MIPFCHKKWCVAAEGCCVHASGRQTDRQRQALRVIAKAADTPEGAHEKSRSRDKRENVQTRSQQNFNSGDTDGS